MINIDNKFDIGQVVYLKTDTQQLARMIIGLCVNKYDILYEMIVGTTTSRHYDFEISEECNVLIKID